MRKKTFMIVAICASLLIPAEIPANVMNYEETITSYNQENKAPQSFQLDDGAGGTVTAVAQNDTLYVIAKSAIIRSKPGDGGEDLGEALFGTTVQRVAVCDNSWSKVTVQKEDGAEINGYVPNDHLSDQAVVETVSDTVTAVQDCDILDFPGRKDGEVVGEVLEDDEVVRTGSIDGIWSRIVYEDTSGSDQEGYIPTNVLEGYNEGSQMAQADTSTSDGTVEAGSIHKSSGEGIFADAVDGVTSTNDGAAAVAGVVEGTPISVSSDAALRPLGMFRITHYCPCSICCGPWANGITSTGVIAVTNRTIAVDPNQIPYGSKVVINGQIYVAEDCGGAIKENCIDVYVGSHEEGESKGVFYTEVYLLEE
ncbi:3D domain-containing protein [Ruminococcus sp. 5_1_39BFAA]|uniref:3D domain-containing protein n=1 Tax=Ruminococcus sp. 5_1_39BFAA TaxID=457412 RepID=UPI0035622ABC